MNNLFRIITGYLAQYRTVLSGLLAPIPLVIGLAACGGGGEFFYLSNKQEFA